MACRLGEQMAEMKTQKNDASVDAFLEGVDDPRKRDDAKAVSAIMAETVGEPPAMWGSAIVGFGHRRIKYESGRELDWMVMGFSPRKTDLTLYLPGGLERLQPLLARLGKHRTGKGCLFIRRFADIDEAVLREIIATSVAGT